MHRIIVLISVLTLLAAACGDDDSSAPESQFEINADGTALVSSADGTATLRVAPGALPAGVEAADLTISRVIPELEQGERGPLAAYELGPDGLEPNQMVPLVITLPAGADPDPVYVLSFGDQIEELAFSTLPEAFGDQAIVVLVPHFSTVVVFAEGGGRFKSEGSRVAGTFAIELQMTGPDAVQVGESFDVDFTLIRHPGERVFEIHQDDWQRPDGSWSIGAVLERTETVESGSDWVILNAITTAQPHPGGTGDIIPPALSGTPAPGTISGTDRYQYPLTFRCSAPGMMTISHMVVVEYSLVEAVITENERYEAGGDTDWRDVVFGFLAEGSLGDSYDIDAVPGFVSRLLAETPRVNRRHLYASLDVLCTAPQTVDTADTTAAPSTTEATTTSEADDEPLQIDLLGLGELECGEFVAGEGETPAECEGDSLIIKATITCLDEECLEGWTLEIENASGTGVLESDTFSMINVTFHTDEGPYTCTQQSIGTTGCFDPDNELVPDAGVEFSADGLHVDFDCSLEMPLCLDSKYDVLELSGLFGRESFDGPAFDLEIRGEILVSF